MARKTAAWRSDLKADPEARGIGLPGSREGQTFEGESVLVRFMNLVKLPHTVFALPFALVGTIYASRQTAVTVWQVLLVTLAFTSARFAAMAFNRIADLEHDALNPRTRDREIPAGRISLVQAMVSVAVASLIFVAAAGFLNPLCLYLSPLALAWILTYSYTKRFTSWSHLWLGASLGIAPVGGYLAITGSWSTPWWTLVVLTVSVLLWVGGFDMFYALQDELFDREHRLKSAVVLLGETRSIFVAKSLHGLAILGLVAFGYGAGLGWMYYAGVVVAAAILAWEHQLVKPGDLSRMNAAFFTMNGVMSLVILGGMVADRCL